MNYPTVRLQYGWLLSDAASTVLNEKYGDGTPLRSYDEYVAIAKQYDEWWQPHSKKILKGLCDITGLEFRQNIIDVYVAPWFHAFSAPMVVGPAFKTEDELVNVLTHEIIHRLLTDNTTYDFYHDFLPDWKSVFGSSHSKNTTVHIPVHAIMEKLYTEVLKRPELVPYDKQYVSNYPDYAKAWDYVEQHGYQTIIDQLDTLKPSDEN